MQPKAAKTVIDSPDHCPEYLNVSIVAWPQVAIDSGYAALVLGVCVIVGFATGLDPAVNLIDAATPCFFVNQLTGRVRGSLYS